MNDTPASRTRSRAFAIASAALLLLACSASAKPRPGHPEQLAQELRARGLDPERVTLPFELSDEMRLWAHEIAPPKLGHLEKLRRLADGLLDPEHLELEYTWGYTGTAVEVFERHQANCLSFTNLFVGMAREVGVPVYFLAVEQIASFRKTDDLVVVSDHMAVGYGHARPPGRAALPPGGGGAALREITVFDFSEERWDKQPENLRRISDLTAIAMFHSNRGAELVQEGRVEESIDWLETAVALDPRLATGWVNLGVSRRRFGDAEGAETAYLKALELDPRTFSAYQNLASLLHTAGRHTEAREYEQVLRESPTRNPYTFLALGDISFHAGRLEEARKFYRRAVSLSPGDAESLAALGEVAAEAGDLRLARKMLRKAQKIDLENRRTARLAERMGTDRS